MERLEVHTKRLCVICDSDKTYIDRHGYSHWRNHEGKSYCKKCYQRLIFNPKYNREYWKRVYTFGDRQLPDYKECRKGVCTKCGKKVGDKYRGFRNKELMSKQTQLHHEFYLVICPWFGRVELCTACHNKIRWDEWRKNKN